MSIDGRSDSDRPLPDLLEEAFVNTVHLSGSEQETDESSERNFSTLPTNPPSQDADAASQFTEFRNSQSIWLSDIDNEERESTHRLSQRLRRRQLHAEERDGSERYLNIEWMLLQPIPSLSGDAANAGLSINIFHIYGNIGVYAGALDSVMNQLLTQMDGSGVPPADKDTIDSLPKVEITQEQVDKSLHCAICLLDFHLKELVKQLGCTHQYHGDCIDKWLLLHGNCPICREDLNGKKSNSKDSSPLDHEESHSQQNFQFPSQ